MASTRSTSHRRVRFENSRPQIGPAGFISDTSEGAIADRDTTDAETDWTDCEAFQPSAPISSPPPTRTSLDNGRPASAGRISAKRSLRNGRSSPNATPEPSGVKRRKDESSDVSELEGAAGLRFACPYFKHDPQTYRTHRTCPGPGWLTVHRVKEHLYRRHSQPPFCPRCFKVFAKDADLSLHLRADPCPVLGGKAPEGLSSVQKDQLKKRLLPGQTEDERWREVYRIAFPNDVAIPSPYMDEANPGEATSFRQGLLRRIRTELLTASAGQVDEREEQFMRRVADIVLKCENEMQQYPTAMQQHSVGSMTAPQPVRPSLSQQWSYLTEEESDPPSIDGQLGSQLGFAGLALDSDSRPSLVIDPALPHDYGIAEHGPQTPVDWIQLVNYPDWIPEPKS